MSDWRRQRSDVLFPKTTENIWKQSFELCMQMVFGKSFSHRGPCSALTMSADKSCPRLHVCTTSNIHFLHHYRTLRPSSQTQLTDTREKRDQKKKKRLPIKKHCYVPLIGFPLSSAMKSSGLTENLTPKGQDDAAWRKRRSLYELWAEEKRVWLPGHGLSLPGERSDYQSTLMIKER